MDDNLECSEGCLSSLLERPFVFERLMPFFDSDDFRHCRLVCRGWRDLFKSLPLSLPSTRQRSIQEIMHSFPGAVAMSVKISDDETPEDVFRKIVSAKNLRRLCVTSFHPWIDVEAATVYFPELAGLQELSLNWRNGEGCPTIYASLHHFTNLTSLKIRSTVQETDALTFLPVLEKLKELRLHLSFDVDPEEDIALPFLTHITHLDIDIEQRSYRGGWKTFEFVLEYRHTLPSLAFSFPKSQDRFHDMFPLTSFTKLERLRVYSHLDNDVLHGATNFLTALEHMTHLTRLDFDLKACSSQAVLEAITHLTSLKHLSYTPVYRTGPRGPQFAPTGFSVLTQLTSLYIARTPNRLYLRGLSNLVDLNIRNEAENIRKLEESLEEMPHLERLYLGFSESCEMVFPRSVLVRIKALKELQLRDAEIDEDL